jgi:hypothetical protein
MLSYTICGYAFNSNVPIPELGLAHTIHPEFTFQLCAEPKDLSESCTWLNHWCSLDGTIWLAFGRLEAGYLLRFPELADFVVSTDAHAVYCYPSVDIPLETVRHLLLNQVIPIVLSHLGQLVLHASACATPQGAVAFMGMTGAGKSTLAASFGLRGLPVLTDDCLLVEEQDGVMMSVPSYPGLRLWPESITALFEHEPLLQPVAHYTEKKRLLFAQKNLNGSVLLSSVYVLEQPKAMEDVISVTITPLAASEALLEIVKHTFQLDSTDRTRLGRAFRQYERLAKCVPFFRLAFPRQYASLSTVNVAILNHLEYIQKRPPM